jgi:(4S)-4-hydroxy-5-phosphonooxypentane-2,3-dione isomerase
MILRIVKMELNETKIELFQLFMNNLKEEKLKQEGCLHYDYFCEKENEMIFYSYTIWMLEKHLKKFKKTELFREVTRTLRTLCVKEPIAWTVENVFNSPYDEEA